MWISRLERRWEAKIVANIYSHVHARKKKGVNRKIKNQCKQSTVPRNFDLK